MHSLFAKHPNRIQELRHYERCLQRAKMTKIQWRFLCNCLDDKVMPNSLLPKALREDKDTPFSDVENKILEERIAKTKREIGFTLYKLREARRSLRESLEDGEYKRSHEIIDRHVERHIKKQEDRLDRKRENLFQNSPWVSASNPDKNIVNMSSYRLKSDEKLVLGYGLNFSTKPTDEFNLDHLVSLLKANKDGALSHDFLTGCLLSSLDVCADNRVGIPRRFTLALKALKNKSDLLITKSDKTNQIVILDRANYYGKLDELLVDDRTYEKLTKKNFRKQGENVQQENEEVAGKNRLV